MMFQPKLVLIMEKGGKYTLLVRTIVPDGCYYAGSISSGTPGGVVGIPEIAYFTAAIERREGICTTALKEIIHTVEGIDLNSGKIGVSVTTTLKGTAVGSGYVGRGAMAAVASAMNVANDVRGDGGVLLPDSVHAAVIGSIFGNYKLVITATAMTSTPGYTASLNKAVPQGISPATLIMDMDLKAPAGKVIQIPGTATAVYSEDNYKGDHSDVTVRLGSQQVTVPIIMIYGFGEAKVAGAAYSALIK